MNEYMNHGYEPEEQPSPVQIARPEPAEFPASPPTPVPTARPEEALRAQLKAKYGKVYRLEQSVIEDDDNDRTVVFYFKRPTTGSFDRYAKTMGQSATRASKAFLLDCVVSESAEDLKAELEENPGMAMSIAAKLTDLLGMSNGVNLKLL